MRSHCCSISLQIQNPVPHIFLKWFFTSFPPDSLVSASGQFTLKPAPKLTVTKVYQDLIYWLVKIIVYLCWFLTAGPLNCVTSEMWKLTGSRLLSSRLTNGSWITTRAVSVLILLKASMPTTDAFWKVSWSFTHALVSNTNVISWRICKTKWNVTNHFIIVLPYSIGLDLSH